MIVPFVLSTLFARCAPGVGPVTMSALVAHESGERPFAIGDNTQRRSYFPSDRARAADLADTLLQAGHNIDLGYAQVNSSNLVMFGVNATQALEPCTNLRIGSQILRSAYAGAALHFGPGQLALVHALSAYNSGGYYAGLAYARDVYAISRTLQYERKTGAVAR